MKTGTYKGKKYYYNEFWMEIYRVEKNKNKNAISTEKLVKVKDFHKYEFAINWQPEYNVLASQQINSKTIENEKHNKY